MADIAILVAEEYERRIKNSTTSESESGARNGDLVGIKWAGAGAWPTLLSSFFNDQNYVKNNKYKYMDEEPKSQIGVAASDGFFSA